MKKITLIHHNMVFGGVEKVLLNLLKNLDREKFKIKLVLFEKEGQLLNELPKDIEIFFLDKRDDVKKKNIIGKINKTIKNTIYYNKQLKKILDEEEVLLILNIRYWMMNLSILNLKNKKIGWFHSTINSDIQTNLIKLNYILFKQYDIIYNVSKEGKDDFDKVLPNLKIKSKILYNSFDVNNIIEKSFESLNENKYIVTVGRLVNSHKGFDVLINAVKKLRDESVDIKLIVVGDGPDREILENQIKEKFLEKNVIIKGFDENPYKWMRKSDAFILSSNYEGLPTVLIEALACEAPIVSTNCKCGPSEILNNGEYGILVPVGDSEALKEGIKKVLLDEKLQKKLKEKSLKRALEFSNEKIIKQLENQILEL